MNKISVCDRELEIKEYDGKRVVTFKDIDEVHQRKTGTARNNFYKNKNISLNMRIISLWPEKILMWLKTTLEKYRQKVLHF